MADYGGAIGISLSQQGGREDDVSPNTNTNTDVAVSSDYMLSGNPSSSTAGCVIRGGKGSSKSPSPSGEITAYRKPRGRPQGSKNKPKPPVIITKDSDAALKSVLLEISPGSDVVESIIHYARRRHVGISVFSASGTVSNVTLRHPGGSPGPMMSLLHGPFSILSLSGSFVEKSFPSAADSSEAACSALVVGCYNSFGICLTAGQGQVFGGIVGGEVVAASAVMVVAATFVNPMVQRLPLPSYNLEEACGGGGSGGGGGEYEAEETKPCIESANVYGGGGGGGGGGGASPAPSSCQQMTSPEQVMPWGPPSSSPNY